MFETKNKQFYRKLRIDGIKLNEYRGYTWIIATDTYSRIINKRAKWLKDLRTKTRPQMQWLEITVEDVKTTTKNWILPGVDKIANYWRKTLTSDHQQLTILW